ncbi:hypothetical protein N7492_002495 [Penicillium capsulatum]|uniref:Uncharacterized protein n=1 Tax=Penicillium capsulatum TaxID=69766 RepID=A0A9W9IIN1_9EURO|nr:hypothetical protein N7492_002495 [Penicillium capsulatum]KAJ6122901.1 hypothetical protein N7512_005366 [Penicillium capsulatum]
MQPTSESDGVIAQKPNRVSKAWRFFTGFFTILLLLGYLILPIVFGHPNERTRIDKTASAVFALFFIGISYIASVVIAFFQRHRKIFVLRSLCVPYLVVNVVSLFNILLNIFGRNLFPLTALRVIGIGLPAGFAVIYALVTYLIYREYGPSAGHRAEDGTPLLSEEEMQRRQLLRLLQERNSTAPSPDLVHNTFRLEIPNLEPVRKSYDNRSYSASRSWSNTSQPVSHVHSFA